jgi:stage IV sporulation protein FB
MLGRLQPTPYDLRFSLFGIPVRVHPVFWLTAAFLSWETDRLDITLVRMLCVFVSVLIHEVGHAVVTRSFGWHPEIALEFFGGYATTTHHSTWRNIAVLFAGPGAGFLLLAAVLGVRAVLEGTEYWQNDYVYAAVEFLIWANLMWNILNLFPIYPLDGGQIVREYATSVSRRNGLKISQMISIGTAGAVALYAVWCATQDLPAFGSLEPRMLAIFFGLFCLDGIQEYQRSQGGGYW